MPGTSLGPEVRFVLRPLDERSLPELLNLYRECEDFLALGPVPQASEQMVLADLAQSQAEGSCFCGILVDDFLAGVVDYLPEGYEGRSGTGYISLLMIASGWRGSGLGRRVAREIEGRILAIPAVRDIMVSVQSNNPRAIAFWENLGYRIVGGPFLMPDTTTVFKLQKELYARNKEKHDRFISVPYGRGSIAVRAGDLALRGVLEPKGTLAPVNTPHAMVREALAVPIGSRPLADLARGKRNVVIVTSDHTRPLPSHITMPLLLEEVRRGNKDAEITILVATGLHRMTTEAELRERFGGAICEQERIVIHSATESDCVDMGLPPSGNRYAVNRLAVEADLLVCEGYIEPHFFAGFSGGRKSILPGVCDASTIRANHSFRTIANPNSSTGVLTDNPVHRDALYAARAVGVDFILNVALDRNKQIAGVFAGDLEEAHQAGCALVADIYSIPRVPGDIVITGNGGYPLDQNLYQCAKAISIAAQCAKPGGVIILAADCADGIGSPEFSELMLAGNPARTLERLKALSDEDTIIDQWCAQVLLEVILKHEIIVVTKNIEPAVLSAMGMTPAQDMVEALSTARSRRGHTAETVVIPDGVSVMVQREGTSG